jgi:hypothetical protein
LREELRTFDEARTGLVDLPDLASLIETAVNTVDDLLLIEESGNWNEAADSILATVVEFLTVACVEILAARLAALSSRNLRSRR